MKIEPTDINGAISVAGGGTGATTAAGARTNLGAVNIAGDTMTGALVVSTVGAALSLDVRQVTAAQVRALETGASVDCRVLALGGAGVVGIFGTFSNHDVVIYVNSTEQSRFSTSGNFQMGGTNTVVDSNRLFRLRQYTVATLPAAGTAGRLAAVTDALGPTYGAVVVGGGAVNTPVYDVSTNWTCR